MNTSKLMLLSLCSIVALSATGCGGSAYHGANTPTPAPMQSAESFTSFSKSMIGTSDMNIPVDVDATVFSFDGDDNPTAYADLFPAG